MLQILELVSVYGLPAVQAIIETWKKDSVTVEDVEVPTDKAGLIAYLNSLVG